MKKLLLLLLSVPASAMICGAETFNWPGMDYEEYCQWTKTLEKQCAPVSVPAENESESEQQLLKVFAENFDYFYPNERIFCFYVDIDGDGIDEAFLSYSSSGRPIFDLDNVFWLAKKSQNNEWFFPFLNKNSRERGNEIFQETPLGFYMKYPIIFVKTKKFPNGGFLEFQFFGDCDLSVPQELPVYLTAFYVVDEQGVKMAPRTTPTPPTPRKNYHMFVPEDLGEDWDFFRKLFGAAGTPNVAGLPAGTPVFSYEIPSWKSPKKCAETGRNAE